MSESHPINPSVCRLARRDAALTVLAMVCIASALEAQTTSTTASTPQPAPAVCPGQPERHQFDFWIGEWNVTTQGGTSVGSSVIQSISGGCAILENWTSRSGGQGKSINSYNPELHQWQQYWVGQDGGVSDYRTSTFDGKSMIFFLKDDGNAQNLQRLTFTPVDAGTVRQHSEGSTDGGKTWKDLYDFYYHRKAR
ncbi:MAG: hypothetical protein ABR585_11305 [Gemmatimonadaceae bacterium]